MAAVSSFPWQGGGRREGSAHGVDDISLSVVNDALDDRRRREWPSVLKARATKKQHISPLPSKKVHQALRKRTLSPKPQALALTGC